MRRLIGRATARLGRRTIAAVAVAAAVVALAAAGALRMLDGEPTYRIIAQFRATPGLYAGNAVDILGVHSGRVVSLTPRPGYVEVVLSLPKRVKIPASARAVLMAPNPVSDRTVELSPAYTGGASLPTGAIIPLQRTVVPLEIDQVYAGIDSLADALGPSGANAHGELSAALHALADLVNGNGADTHAAIDAIASALPALTAHPDQLAKLIDGLDTLTRTLATRSDTINALYGDLASATSDLAAERDAITAVVANLQRGLADVAQFLKANAAHIGGSVRNLSAVVSAVIKDQESLVQTFDTAALGFENFTTGIDRHANCVDHKASDCAAAWARVDVTKGAFEIVKAYCGNSVMPSFVDIIAANAKLAQATAKHTDCGAEFGLLQGHDGPPNAPPTPDLDLSHYLGTR